MSDHPETPETPETPDASPTARTRAVLAERQRLLDDRALQGLEWCAAWSTVVDRWLIDLYTNVFADADDVCMLAVGGTGRGELAPRSDLDLLVVHRRGTPRLVEAAVGRLWYPIWDTGISLGHGVRSANEKLKPSAENLETATTLLSGRLLAGDARLAAEVLSGARAAWSAKAGDWLPLLREADLERHRSAGEVAFLLEPALKDGRGGLRDAQVIDWLAAAAPAAPDVSVGADPAEVHHAYVDLYRARVALHRCSASPGDVLHLEDQDGVAASGGFGDADELMARVSAAARTIAWHNDRVWLALDRLAARSVAPRPLASGVSLRNGEVELDTDALPAADPTLMLQVALGAARTDEPISLATLERLAADTPVWPDPWPAGARDELVALLLEGDRAVPVLESLDQVELINRMLPEWLPVRSRPQRNAYHRFTVDRHLWEAAARAAALVDRVARPDLLVIGALLHDLGKGYPGDHTEAGIELVKVIGPRLGYHDADVLTLVAMVEHHLLLPDVATRRDLSDDGTIRLVISPLEFMQRLSATMLRSRPSPVTASRLSISAIGCPAWVGSMSSAQ